MKSETADNGGLTPVLIYKVRFLHMETLKRMRSIFEQEDSYPKEYIVEAF